MPLAEFFMSEGALPEAEIAPLARRITEICLRHQGARPGSPTAASIACLEVTEIPRGRLFVGGAESASPRYRLRFTTPAGALGAEAKAALVHEVTLAVLAAEGTPFDEADACRVWCIVDEVPDGNWSSGGKVVGWRDVMRHVLRGDALLRRRERLVARSAEREPAE